ncbi:helix-turn-helix domain-containing protein [Oerskovia sp. M15]
MDPRTERTTAALRTAILELAAQQDIDALTVSQVAARAGINRATFYDYASNPPTSSRASCAPSSMRSARASSRRPRAWHPTRPPARGRPPDGPRHLVDAITHSVAAHVDAHAAIYERAREGGLSARCSASSRSTSPRRSAPSSSATRTSCRSSRGRARRRRAGRSRLCLLRRPRLRRSPRGLAGHPCPTRPGLLPRIARTSLASWWTAPN